MALVSTGGLTNIESDVALADAGTLTITRPPNAPGQVTVISISLGPINAASTNTCGKVDLRQDTTIIWTGYVFFVASATGQSLTKTFPLGITITPTASGSKLNVLYTNITNASTASVSIMWK